MDARGSDPSLATLNSLTLPSLSSLFSKIKTIIMGISIVLLFTMFQAHSTAFACSLKLHHIAMKYCSDLYFTHEEIKAERVEFPGPRAPATKW